MYFFSLVWSDCPKTRPEPPQKFNEADPPDISEAWKKKNTWEHVQKLELRALSPEKSPGNIFIYYGITSPGAVAGKNWTLTPDKPPNLRLQWLLPKTKNIYKLIGPTGTRAEQDVTHSRANKFHGITSPGPVSVTQFVGDVAIFATANRTNIYLMLQSHHFIWT